MVPKHRNDGSTLPPAEGQDATGKEEEIDVLLHGLDFRACSVDVLEQADVGLNEMACRFRIQVLGDLHDDVLRSRIVAL